MAMARDVPGTMVRYWNGNGRNAEGVVEQGRPAGMSKEDYLKKRDSILSEHFMTIKDARASPGGLSSWGFEEHGFCMMPTPEPVADFGDKALVQKEYLPRMSEAVKKATGAKRVFIMSYSNRGNDLRGIKENTMSNLSYADYAHTDFGPEMEPLFRRMLAVREKVPEEEAMSCGLAVVTVWHPWDRPAYKQPLCLVDGRTVVGDPVKQIVPFLSLMDMGYGKNVEKVPGSRVPIAGIDAPAAGAAYDPNHQWVFCPDMQPTEGWLFKQYDYRPEAKTKVAYHYSFKDTHHDAWAECPDRRSVEFRILVTFDSEKSSAAKL